MKIIVSTKRIKEWLIHLVETRPEFWKSKVTRYNDGIKEVLISCFTANADKDYFDVVSEALDVLFHVMELGNDTCGISAHLCQTGSRRTTFEVTFYWEEEDE